MLAKGYQIQIRYTNQPFKWFDLFGKKCWFPTLRQALIKYNELHQKNLHIVSLVDEIRIVRKKVKIK